MNNEIINLEINRLRNEDTNFNNLNEAYIFPLVCVKYFFYGGDYNISNHRETYTDGTNDGGIDGVHIVEGDSGLKKLICIQGKTYKKAKTQTIVDVFTKMHQTIIEFRNGQTENYNQRLKRILASAIDDEQEDVDLETISLYLFISIKVSEKIKNKVKERLNTINEMSNYDIQIIDLDEIIKKINSINDSMLFVENDHIRYYHNNGILKANMTNNEEDANTVIISVNSSSLKRLDTKYATSGLYDKNYRFYTPKPKIDKDIKKTITDNPSNFINLNNGVIIGCNKFKLNTNKDDEYKEGFIKLEKFSIINGCQTVSIIGKSENVSEQRDFPVICKLVKVPNGENFNEYIKEIAKASNSQKPINERNLKSNDVVQINLQQILKNGLPSIFLQRKDGELIKDEAVKQVKTEGKNWVDEKWRFIKNEYLAQLILAFNIQKPGTSRSSKKSIWTNEILYKNIFNDELDRNFIIDVLLLNKRLQIILPDMETVNEGRYEEVVRNGELFYLSILGYLLKIKKNIIDAKPLINDEERQWLSNLTSVNVRERFLREQTKDFDDALFELIKEITDALYSSVNENINSRNALVKNVSNFFKSDNIYYKEILSKIYFKLFYGETAKNNTMNLIAKIFI